MMSTREVADYLRIKERKVYDLVRAGRIPSTRVTGKWLFPKRLIDQWVAAHTEMPADAVPLAPKVAVGSHDPLLDWAIRESGSDLALLAGGSLDGLRRFADGQAMLCGLHLRDGATGDYNLPFLRPLLAGRDVVLIHWAWRKQGLVVAAQNPLGIGGLADLKKKRARLALRQAGAGSQVLLQGLLEAEGLALTALKAADSVARSETDLALMIQEGKADAGLAIEAAARQFRLDFIPLERERFDLVVQRRAYFEPALQTLFSFARTNDFEDRAKRLGGYDVAETGRVMENNI
jgi:putative molybdopterin biosynthesis protein